MKQRGARSALRSLPGFDSENERIEALRSIRKQGNPPGALAEFAARNFNLVHRIAAYYHSRFKGIDYEDLCQEGYIGILQAAERFDFSRELRFSTYANIWIRQCMLRAIQERMFLRPFRVPTSVEQEIMQWSKVSRVLARELGRTPTMDEIGQRYVALRTKDVRASALVRTAARVQHVGLAVKVPLETPVSDTTEGYRTLADTVVDAFDSPEGAMIRAQDRDLARRIVLFARKRIHALLQEERILPWHAAVFQQYVCDHVDGDPLTYSALAEAFGCSRERARQILLRLDRFLKLDPGYSLEAVFAAARVLDE